MTRRRTFLVARGVVVLPKSVTEKRIIDNFKVIDLTADELSVLNDLHKETTKRFVKPDWGVDLKFDNWET